MIGRWFSPGTLVSSTIKTDQYCITEILLKVALNTINQPILIHDISPGLKQEVTRWVPRVEQELPTPLEHKNSHSVSLFILYYIDITPIV